MLKYGLVSIESRIPETETQGVHTSAATVAVLRSGGCRYKY